jgi:hypothetical protein
MAMLFKKAIFEGLGTWGLGDLRTWGLGDLRTWGLGDLGNFLISPILLV